MGRSMVTVCDACGMSVITYPGGDVEWWDATPVGWFENRDTGLTYCPVCVKRDMPEKARRPGDVGELTRE